MSEPADGSPGIRPPEPDFTDLPADAPWWARWLVANWRSIWREASSWFFGLIGLLAALPFAFPELKDQPSYHGLMVGCAIAGFISKFVKQRPRGQAVDGK